MHRVRLAVRENRLTSDVIRPEHYIPQIEVTGRGWVVVDSNEIVAFAIGNRDAQNIWALFVDPRHERQGHGRRLHDVMVDWLFAQGLQRIGLSTAPGTRAQQFYEAAGWRFVRALPDGERCYDMHRTRVDDTALMTLNR
jgi:GNAT superfamily N-acetyltransferase